MRMKRAVRHCAIASAVMLLVPILCCGLYQVAACPNIHESELYHVFCLDPPRTEEELIELEEIRRRREGVIATAEATRLEATLTEEANDAD